jgi:hypothetical protein
MEEIVLHYEALLEKALSWLIRVWLLEALLLL